jgi:FKBP-type peptidyl-prolyl cis-trans isomerase
MGIVRAMKQHTLRLLPRSYGVCILLAIAPLAGAQNPSTAPATPPAPPTAPAAPAAPAAPTLSNEQASYLFGLTFGEQLHSIGLSNEVMTDAVMRGMKEAMQGKKSTPAERQQVQDYVRASIGALAARNKTAAQEFLARNGHEKGVKTTASGLQYKVLAAGDAKAAAISATDEVTVNYRGKLLDGTEFDSSYTKGVPATFGLSGVIKGWQEGLVMMKPGAKWVLYVPPELAYGANARPLIPANSLLIFDVEVISAKASTGMPPGGAPPIRRPPPPTTP